MAITIRMPSAGLEPATSHLGNERSIQMSYEGGAGENSEFLLVRRVQTATPSFDLADIPPDPLFRLLHAATSMGGRFELRSPLKYSGVLPGFAWKVSRAMPELCSKPLNQVHYPTIANENP